MGGQEFLANFQSIFSWSALTLIHFGSDFCGPAEELLKGLERGQTKGRNGFSTQNRRSRRFQPPGSTVFDLEVLFAAIAVVD